MAVVTLPASASEPPLPDEFDDPYDEPADWSAELEESPFDPQLLAAESAAMAAAVAADEPVEVAELTNEREQVVADPATGTFTAELAPFPVRARDRISGAWVDIDTTLQLDPDGVIRPVAAASRRCQIHLRPGR